MTKTKERNDKSRLDKTLLGQLIAEISKFGGADKKKSSQLATILLPYIDQYATSLIEAEVEKVVEKERGKAKQQLLSLLEEEKIKDWNEIEIDLCGRIPYKERLIAGQIRNYFTNRLQALKQKEKE